MDEILYKEPGNTFQDLNKDKKRQLFQEKLSEDIEKPKELWKIIKNWVHKKAPTTSIYISTKREMIFSPWTIRNTFKKYFTNLTSDLVKKLPDPTGKS